MGDEFKFGDLAAVPFSEPAWYDSRNGNLLYTDAHKAWRQTMRTFVDKEIMPFRDEWDAKGQLPATLYQKAGAIGLLSAVIGWPEDCSPIPRPKGYDGAFTQIAVDELCRCGSGGIVWGLIGGLGIGCPPIYFAGTDEMKRDVVPAILRGDKKCCLAISEPQAGSDVANLTTTAAEEGDFFVLAGQKKWITGATFADYAVVAARTGGAGMGGLSLILVDCKSPGFNVRTMDCMGAKGSGTGFIELDDVRVPKKNLIGDVTVLLRNFVTERLGIAIQATRFARVCLYETITYARRRKAFGKPLVEMPVVRAKIATMAREVEVSQAYVESMVARLVAQERSGEDWFDSILRLGAEAALCKVQATRTFEHAAREAAMIHGGNAYITGNRIEHLYRQTLSLAIPGGSEDVLTDAAARLALQGKL